MHTVSDDLCAMNDGGEFGRSNTEICPPELELKIRAEIVRGFMGVA
jgi:hypothetical protein